MIQTVTERIDESHVHSTLAHEHLVFGFPGMKEDPDNKYQPDTAYENCRVRIDMIRPYDVNLIVDPTPIECGRDPLFLKRIAEDMNIFIVCATGFFKDDENALSILKTVSYTEDLERLLRDLYIREITEGIGETGVKAGIIKVASSFQEIKPLEKVLIRAAANAGNQTGVPVFTHCDRGTMGIEQAELFLACGVNPGHVVIGHQTSNPNLDEICRIMDLGFTVGFDQFGILSIPGIPTDEEKTENLLSLLEKGYEDQIVLSHDTIFDRMGYVSSSKPRYTDQIYREIIPILKTHGISENTIRKLTRDNLLRVFQ
ncbi:MAG: hypothetical protein IJ225_05805 [Solobacterium sp.]|nr:hypothetical protein [Solobacterium sp.]